MPVQHTYPGVYIEELPSGVHTIVGVSTSDTAFIDFFKRGPINTAVRVESYNDFERQFGGLDTRSEASYAIYQYYLNGGSAAWVVRVAPNATEATLTMRSGWIGSAYYSASGTDVLKVSAASPGEWGNHLWVAAQRLPVKAGQPDLFNFFIQERALDRNGNVQVVNSETYLNLSMDITSSRYAVKVVGHQSLLVSLTDDNAVGMVPDSGLDGKGQPIFVQLGLTATSDTPGTDGDVPGGSNWDGSIGVNAIIGGLAALDLIAPKIFNILCIPAAAAFSSPTSTQAAYSAALTYCELKRAFLIIDIAPDVVLGKAETWLGDVGITPSKNGAIYYPRLEIPDALNEYRLRDVGPSGTLAGVYARTDSTRGIWKAPAGIDASLRGAEVVVKLTDDQDGDINPLGVNALRNFPIYGNVCWGARTLEGADQQASEWKYIPIRRLALFIEETLYENTKWVVFEPNDEPLWAQIRLNIGAFMHDLFRQGAFQGMTAKDAYFVKCDSTTTTQSDVNAGVVNIVVGFAPLKPAEFVVIKIQQIAGQIQT